VKKARIFVRVLVFTLAAGFGIFLVVYANGYVATSNSVLNVDKASIEVNVDSQGVAHIQEHEFYTFKKPYHGLAPYMELPDGVYLQNFKISVDGAKMLEKTGKVTQHGFDLKVYLNKGYNVPKPGGDKVEMNLSYDVYNAVQVGKDFSQFFHKFWGADTPSWVPNLTVIYKFDPKFDVKDVFVHPLDVSHLIRHENNIYAITYSNLPPNAYAEARFVFPKTNVLYHSSIDKSYSDVLKIENGYVQRAKIIWISWMILLALAVVIPFTAFYFFGREPHVELNSEYERDVPYDDPPAVVNAIVKRIVSDPDGDAFAATILSLVEKGYLEFAGKSAFKLKASKKPLDEIEDLLLKLVIKPYAVEGIFDPETLRDSMKGNVKFSKEFLSAYNNWKAKSSLEAEGRSYIITYGNTIAKILAIGVLIIVPLAFLAYVISVKEYPMIAQYASWFAFFDWTIAWIMLVLPKDVFGRWTKNGRKYYLRWKNFEKYLTDYSLLKEKPPESVILWDKYLIYGTALGVAKKVTKAIKEIDPKIVESSPLYPAWIDMYWYSSVYRLPMYASANSVQSKGGSSGGFGGDIGGGFGGGGRGGF
jgi:uncharacterized membrane protein